MTRALETRLPVLGTNCEFGYRALQPIQFRIGQAGSGLYVLGGVECVDGALLVRAFLTTRKPGRVQSTAFDCFRDAAETDGLNACRVRAQTA